MTIGRTGVSIAEWASLILATLNLGAAAWVGSTGSAAEALKAPLLLSFGFCLVIALLIAAQFTLLARQLDPSEPTGGDLDGLRGKDLRRLLRWSPLLHRSVGALGLLLLMVTLLSVGGVTWTTGSPFERRHAIGLALYGAALYAIAAPILAALARMPLESGELARAFKADDA